jgi:large subunit ribosomal protein L4
MEVKLLSENEQSEASVTISDTVFDRKYNEPLVHQLVTSYLANARSANRAQKERSDVSKSTHKPWRQKGTGRARAGAASSPIWRGGGKIFANSPDENFSHKVNRKAYRAGMSVIFSQLMRDNRLLVIDSFTVEQPKTKELSAKIKNLGLDEVMIITDKIDNNLYLSARNIPRLKVIEASQADPYNLLRYEKTLVTAEGMKRIEELMA